MNHEEQYLVRNRLLNLSLLAQQSKRTTATSLECRSKLVRGADRHLTLLRDPSIIREEIVLSSCIAFWWSVYTKRWTFVKAVIIPVSLFEVTSSLVDSCCSCDRVSDVKVYTSCVLLDVFREYIWILASFSSAERMKCEVYVVVCGADTVPVII